MLRLGLNVEQQKMSISIITKQSICIINSHHLRLIFSQNFLSSMFVYILTHEISSIHIEVHITVIVNYYVYCDINGCLNLIV